MVFFGVIFPTEVSFFCIMCVLVQIFYKAGAPCQDLFIWSLTSTGQVIGDILQSGADLCDELHMTTYGISII